LLALGLSGTYLDKGKEEINSGARPLLWVPTTSLNATSSCQ